MSTSGPPKWVFPVLGLLGIAILAVGFSIYKVATAPPPGLAPPPPPPAPVAVPAPAPAAGEAAKPAAPEEKPAPPAAEGKAPDKAKSASGKGDKGRRKGGDQSGSGKGAAEAKKGGETTATTPTQPTEGGTKRTDKKGKQSLDDLLGEVGSKKTGGGDDSAAKPVVKLITLTQSDIVSAMKGVQPKVQACANQFKAPGTAMANISVVTGGRVSSVTVTGKFAGTPSGSCVETAAKSAKFPPCQSMTFPWPFTLSPR